MSIRTRIDGKGRKVHCIHLTFRNRTTGRQERYRKDAKVQSKSGALTQEREVIAYFEAHGTVAPLLAPYAVVEPSPETDGAKTWTDAVTRYETVYAPSLKHSTATGYSELLKHAVFTPWATLPLTSIGRPQVDEWDARVIRLKVSPSRRRNFHSIMRTVLRVAVDAGYISELPRLPSLPRVGRTEVVAASGELVHAVLSESDEGEYDHVANDRKAARLAFALAAYAGLRASEVRGLRWSDVDLAKKTLTVSRGRIHGVEGAPKGRHERRIPLAAPLAKILTAAASKPHTPESFVCLRGDGKTWGDSGLIQALRRTCDRLGLDVAKVHSLRHFFVTSLFTHGVGAQVVRDLAGHADLTTTNRYAHATEQAKASAMSAFGPVRLVRKKA